MHPLAAAAAARLIDRPMFGSIPAVHEGKLVGLAGGDVADVARLRRAFDPLVRDVVPMGASGSCSPMKLNVNLGMATYLQPSAESLALAERQCLQPDRVLDTSVGR